MNKRISVAILGSTGYVGLELLKILSRHPNVDINFLGCNNLINVKLSELDKKIDISRLPELSLNNDFNPLNYDAVFLALPHGISHKFVKKFFDKIKIFDLSAEFRLDTIESYNSSYNNDHSCEHLLKNFVYGLPEINRDSIIKSDNIAIPGCYPTSILIPLIPLLTNNLIKTDNIIIDSKSGYSGAGKKFDINNIKSLKDFNFYNYNTNEHRHISEIKQELQKHSKEEINFSFNPHVLPCFRGMMSTIYCDLNEKIFKKDILKTLKVYTKNLPFVNLIDKENKFDFFSIQNTNDCLIKIFNHNNTSKIIIVTLIDNLVKGASGQAVQCFNLSFNFSENLSLKQL